MGVSIFFQNWRFPNSVMVGHWGPKFIIGAPTQWYWPGMGSFSKSIFNLNWRFHNSVVVGHRGLKFVKGAPTDGYLTGMVSFSKSIFWPKLIKDKLIPQLSNSIRFYSPLSYHQTLSSWCCVPSLPSSNTRTSVLEPTSQAGRNSQHFTLNTSVTQF